MESVCLVFSEQHKQEESAFGAQRRKRIRARRRILKTIYIFIDLREEERQKHQ